MLPAPTLSFTIPSIHDDTVLDCRIYLPASITTIDSQCSTSTRKKAAIIAHPYGPMGGSYDDPIVDLVASAVLKQDFVVGTFNFRGAGGSKGRTSWTAKAETNDYSSVIGFMVYFMHELKSDTLSQLLFDEEESPIRHDLSPIPSHVLPTPQPHRSDSSRSYRHSTQALVNTDGKLIIDTTFSKSKDPVLLMGGYSYGSLITSLLPPLQTILVQFCTPELGTAASEIRLRATQLASKQNEIFESLAAQYRLRSRSEGNLSPLHKRGRSLQVDPVSPRKISTSSSVRIGGEESTSEHRRISHEFQHGRRSFDPGESVRRSVDRVRSITRKSNSQVLSPKRHVSYSAAMSNRKSLGSKRSIASLEVTLGDDADTRASMQAVELGHIIPAYLMVSPLQGFVNSLATMWSAVPRVKTKQGESSEEEIKLCKNTTLAIYGDADIFTSSKKLRIWSEKLRQENSSSFRSQELHGAGHFWHEDGMAHKMRDLVKDFATNL